MPKLQLLTRGGIEVNRNVKVLICDSHPALRYGLSQMLQLEDAIDVVAEVATSGELVLAVPSIKPDIVIIDIGNECCDIDVIHNALSGEASFKIIVYTSETNDEIIKKAAKLGVYGYLLKKTDVTELAKAIHTVYKNGTVLDPDFATKLLWHMRTVPERSQTDQDSLSKRELEVLRLLADGESNRNIAAKLYIGECTVKFHVSSILTKLNVKNRTEAAAIAIQAGMIYKPANNLRH